MPSAPWRRACSAHMLVVNYAQLDEEMLAKALTDLGERAKD